MKRSLINLVAIGLLTGCASTAINNNKPVSIELSTDPEHPKVGEQIVLHVNVKNTGDKPASVKILSEILTFPLIGNEEPGYGFGPKGKVYGCGRDQKKLEVGQSIFTQFNINSDLEQVVQAQVELELEISRGEQVITETFKSPVKVIKIQR